MNLRQSFKTGLGFGVTSGVITTLGLMVGLISATGSKTIAIAGVLTIAIADALSDSFGIHVSEESKNGIHTEIWEATFTTFLFKLITSLSFLIPILLFSLESALVISSVWGILLLSFLSYNISIAKNEDYRKAVVEHIIIALFVIGVTYLIGEWIRVFIL